MIPTLNNLQTAFEQIKNASDYASIGPIHRGSTQMMSINRLANIGIAALADGRYDVAFERLKSIISLLDQMVDEDAEVTARAKLLEWVHEATGEVIPTRGGRLDAEAICRAYNKALIDYFTESNRGENDFTIADGTTWADVLQTSHLLQWADTEFVVWVSGEITHGSFLSRAREHLQSLLLSALKSIHDVSMVNKLLEEQLWTSECDEFGW